MPYKNLYSELKYEYLLDWSENIDVKLCVEWGSNNTSCHIDVHCVHIYIKCKLKHNGIWGLGVYGLNGWGIGSNEWCSYGKVSCCSFLGDTLKKHWSSLDCSGNIDY